MNLEEKLSNVVRRHEEIEALLSSNIAPDEMVKLNKELSTLTPIVESIRQYQKNLANLNDAQE
ncbi:MAG: peptide chain release factor 1, partial [Alphaproteobacteria bacterium]|nr:peptide chain release factor 1 [Alphaproteobacteria bacterium]